MTNTTHTPAPWVIEGLTIWNPETKRAIFATGHKKPINERDEMGQADARLISAAPELLEALNKLSIIALNGGCAVPESVYIAIAKARGQS